MSIRTHTAFDSSLKIDNGNSSMAYAKIALLCEVLFNASSFESDHCWINYMNNAGTDTVLACTCRNDGSVYFILDSGSGYTSWLGSGTGLVPLNILNHLTYSLDYPNHTVRACLNGVQIYFFEFGVTPVITPSLNCSEIRLNSARTSNGGNMLGSLYQMKLYDTLITEDRAKKLYNQMVLMGGKGSVDMDGLMFWSKFNNEASGIVPVQTANAYGDFIGKYKFSRDNISINIDFQPNIF